MTDEKQGGGGRKFEEKIRKFEEKIRYLPTPSHGQDVTQGHFLGSLAGLNSVFFFPDWLPNKG